MTEQQRSSSTGTRSPVIRYGALREGSGAVRVWVRTIAGVPYRFTAVLMPDGERRYVVNRYNGYGDDGTEGGRETGMRFDCAWNRVHFIVIKEQQS
jgi:hypothetical protein